LIEIPVGALAGATIDHHDAVTFAPVQVKRMVA
jgi:hypothetical protein